MTRGAQRATRRAVRIARALAGCALLGAGCVSYDSGLLAAVSVETLPLQTSVVSESVSGRSCAPLGEERLSQAIDDAVRKAPGATALVDAAFTFERLCLVVRGKAVRIEKAAIDRRQLNTIAARRKASNEPCTLGRRCQGGNGRFSLTTAPCRDVLLHRDFGSRRARLGVGNDVDGGKPR